MLLSKTKYRKDIQALRGLAVLAVVLFHAKESYFPLGYLGVDVFFIISGFVVTPLILRIFTEQTIGGRFSSLKLFYKRRFYRLAPALTVVLAISAVAILLIGPPGDHSRFAIQGVATLLLVANLGAYKGSPDYFAPNPNPLIHTWSLSVEEQIYIFLPLVLFLVLFNIRNVKKIISIVFVLVAAFSFITFLVPTILLSVYNWVGIEFASQFAFYSPLSRVWQFILGGLCYFSLSRYQNLENRFSRVSSLVLIGVMLIVLFGPLRVEQKASSILISLIAIVVIRFRSLETLPNFISTKLEWLGDRSYSIYLVHLPLLYLAKYSLLTKFGNMESRVIQTIIAVIASILLGALSYSRIENRFRNYGKNSTLNFKKISVTLVLTLVAPMAIFVSINSAAKNDYWGIYRGIIKPPYAGEFDPKCLRDSKAGPPCIYKNKSATKTVLLIGDSHAGHISQAVVDSAKIANWNSVIWTHGGCRIKFRQTTDVDFLANCVENNQRMKEWVLANKPDAIIASEYIVATYPQNDLKSALLDLKSIVPNILLIENNPIFPDEKNYMVKQPLIMSPYEPPKYFKLSEMQTEDQKDSNEFAKWARGNGISTMNFASLFCDAKICTRYADNEWLYYDDDHFSVAGAARTIPQLSTFLKRS